MISNRPYLIRAFHEWIVDSQCTPILVLDANHPRCKIPKDYAEGGEIVFNVSAAAVRDLKIANELIEFKASFSGVIHMISAPISAALAIYAEENGEGLFFDGDDEIEKGMLTEESDEGSGRGNITLHHSVDESTLDAINTSSNPSNKSKPFLRLVE